LATYFGSSEPYSGQFLTYRHGAFSECAHYVRTHRLYIKNWPEDGSLEPKHVANYVLMIIHICCVWINITLSYYITQRDGSYKKNQKYVYCLFRMAYVCSCFAVIC